jgi:thymidylate kinase
LPQNENAKHSNKHAGLICFSGIDGSGKTAHSLRTYQDLQKSGRKCRYLWFGTPYFISYPFMALCRFLNLTSRYQVSNKLVVSEHQYYKNKPVAFLWPWIQFLDLSVYTFFEVRLPIWAKSSIVCDRFIHDILVELMADVNDALLLKKPVGRLILKLKPKGTTTFFLDVNVKDAFQRRPDVPNLRYLTRRMNYHRLIRAIADADVTVVDANQPFITVQEEIAADLNRID